MDSPLLTYLQHFRHFTDSDKQYIDAGFEHKKFKEGEHLFKGGRTCRELFLLLMACCALW